MKYLLLCLASWGIFIYPFIIYPFILRFIKVKPNQNEYKKTTQSFALFFSAFNEASSLPRTLSWLKELKGIWPELSIWAYNDCSSDGTKSLLENAKFLNVIHGEKRFGKPAGLRKLIDCSNAEIGIFIDANVIADVNSVLNFKTYFMDDNIGTVGATLCYLHDNDLNSKYWKSEEKLKALECISGSTPGADGSMFATRISIYPLFPTDNADDFRVSMETIIQGKKCISADNIFVYEMPTQSIFDEIKRKKRISCGAYAAHRHMQKDLKKISALDKFKYFSHRWLRWNCGIFLCLGFAFGIKFLLLNPILIIPLIFSFLVIISTKFGLNLTKRFIDLFLSVMAVQVGVFENLFGKSYRTWTPPNSRNEFNIT